MPVMNAASAKSSSAGRSQACGQFHEARARPRQLHQRIGAPRQVAAVGVQQQLRPARDLPRAGGNDRLAQRRDIAPQPECARIDEAQQLHHHARVQLELRFELDDAGIARQQRQQAQQARPRRAVARRGQHLRPREKVALEQIEAELTREREVLARLDLFGDQRLALPAHERRQLSAARRGRSAESRS